MCNTQACNTEARTWHKQEQARDRRACKTCKCARRHTNACDTQEDPCAHATHKHVCDKREGHASMCVDRSMHDMSAGTHTQACMTHKCMRYTETCTTQAHTCMHAWQSYMQQVTGKRAQTHKRTRDKHGLQVTRKHVQTSGRADTNAHTHKQACNKCACTQARTTQVCVALKRAHTHAHKHVRHASTSDKQRAMVHIDTHKGTCDTQAQTQKCAYGTQKYVHNTQVHVWQARNKEVRMTQRSMYVLPCTHTSACNTITQYKEVCMWHTSTCMLTHAHMSARDKCTQWKEEHARYKQVCNASSHGVRDKKACTHTCKQATEAHVHHTQVCTRQTTGKCVHRHTSVHVTSTCNTHVTCKCLQTSGRADTHTTHKEACVSHRHTDISVHAYTNKCMAQAHVHTCRAHLRICCAHKCVPKSTCVCYTVAWDMQAHVQAQACATLKSMHTHTYKHACTQVRDTCKHLQQATRTRVSRPTQACMWQVGTWTQASTHTSMHAP